MNRHTAELLEKHFDTAFAAPGGIKKLRELILTLAMQGRLVPQDPDDPPASELLKEIEAEKQRLVKEDKIKKPNLLPPVTEQEKPYTLPQEWEWVRFGEIAQHNSGKTLDCGRNTGLPRRYITTSNVYWGKFQLNNVREMLIREDELDKCSARKGDLLICEGGEAGRAAVWELDEEICFQNHLHRARFYEDVNPYFAYRFFEKINASGEINNYRKGVGISNMSSKVLASIVFPLPPKSEHHRIVAKIDELMARCDELEKLRTAQQDKRLTIHAAAIKQLLNIAEPDRHQHAQAFLAEHFDELYTIKENVAELRKTILQLAVMGKLVPQNPNDQPASELLKEIEAEKQRLVQEGKIKKLKSLPPIAEQEKPYALPRGWEWVRFDGLINQEFPIGYGVLVPGPDVEDGMPFVRIEDLDIKAPKAQPGKQISESIAQKFERTRLIGGEILMGVVGSIGKLGIAPKEWAGAYIARAVCRIVPTYMVSKKYILWILQSGFMQRNFHGNTRILAQPTLNIGLIRNSLTPLPPLAEQECIVSKINQLILQCDSLEHQIDAATKKRAELLNALLQPQSQATSKEQPVNDMPCVTAEIVNLAAYRAAIGCYVVEKLANAPYFGRTAATKVMYLAQAHVGLELNLRPEREAAGPLDTWIYDFERQGQSQGWFEVDEKTLTTGRKKTEYRCLSALSEPVAKAEALMSSGQKAEFDRLIYTLADKKTEEVEIIATLFAVWNDFLIDGIQPTDEQIISDMRKNWHNRKARFSPAGLGRWLDWLRGEKIIPRGLPPRTVQQPKLKLD